MASTHSMMPGEQEILRGRVHPACLAPIALLCIAEGFIFWGIDLPGAYWIYVLIFFALQFLPRLIWLLCTELVLTNRRLYGKLVPLKISEVVVTLDAPLNKLNTVGVSIGLLGRFLGYGNIRVGTSSPDFIFHCIRTPEQFRQAVMEEIQRFEDEARRS